KSFSDIREKLRKQALEGTESRVFFNLERPDGKINGMRKTEVAYLLGRSGSGKTTFALNYIHNAIFNQGKNIVFNSLVLDGANIAPHLLQIHMGFTEQQVTDLVLSDNKGLEPIYEKLDKHLKVVDRSGQTLQDIENYVRMCNDTGFPVDAVFIDYFGYIKRPMRNSSY